LVYDLFCLVSSLVVTSIQTGLRGRHLQRLDAQPVRVPEEQDALAFALGTLARFNPLAHAGTAPHGLDEPDGAVPGVRAVVAAHNLLERLGGLIGIVEGDRGDVVVQNVGLDDTVEELAADEAELAIDGGGSATDVVPRLRGVVGERWVGMLQEGNGNCGNEVSKGSPEGPEIRGEGVDLPSQWLTQR
jgi:hypothetical protein